MVIDIDASGWRLRMTYGQPGLNGSHLQRLIDLAAVIHQAMPLDRFRFQQDDATPEVYSYRIWLIDGRQWKQEITFESPLDEDPSMIFDVAPGWKLSEFSAHRDWRALMVDLRNGLGATDVRLDPPT